jgi:probable DNA repair protein
MMQCTTDKNQLFDLMAHGALVLTPNNRLSAALEQEFFKKANAYSVKKPKCLPYSTALALAFEEFIFHTPEFNHPILLSTSQCQHLWRRLIQSHPTIVYSEGLLHEVMQAWEQCQQWQISFENPHFKTTAQTRLFQQWWQKVQEQLGQMNLITQHQLPAYLMQSGLSFWNQTVVWVCFDSFTPTQLSLQEYLAQLGVAQTVYDLAESTTTARLFAASSSKDEFEQIIAFLHQKLQSGEERIGLVVPELQQQWRPLQRLMHDHFDPALVDVSLGQSLADFPLVAHALVWLQLNTQTLTRHQAALFLQSPYLAHAQEEFLERSHYLQDSHLLQTHTLSLKCFTDELTAHAPKLSFLLQQLNNYPEKTSTQEWANIFQERLNGLGFPGNSGLNSENYQCFQRFLSVFDEFRQLAVISPQLKAHEALSSFVQLARSTIFQPQKTKARIQISGLLEASGCEFESLWIMGLHDQCLPQKVRLSAFIPLHLQRDLQMPHSLASRELLLAKQLLNRLRNASKNLVFSYPALQGDNPYLACTLIADTPAFQKLPPIQSHEDDLVVLDYEEQYLIPLVHQEQISGNTALLANQAKCPFKAFAEHRLKAKPEPKTRDGLDNKERGKILHKAMELIWKKIRTQECLVALSPSALASHIDNALETLLEAIEDSVIKEVEYKRLKKIVMHCLEWEKNRPAFKVSALEHSYSISLAGLNFQVRVDRLDDVCDKKWVIDYKSTLPNTKPWLEERPKEPQMLLYALLDEAINTLVLLELKSKGVACSGLSEVAQAIPGITSLKGQETWEEQRSKWKDQLHVLADEFQKGHCPPQPSHPSLCQTCDFQSLCRFQAID